MELTCPRCDVPGVLPEMLGILPRTLFCGNCKAQVVYRGSLLELVSADNEELIPEATRTVRSWGGAVYLTPKYRTPGAAVVIEPAAPEEVLKDVSTKALLHLLRESYVHSVCSVSVRTKKHGIQSIAVDLIRSTLNGREHLPRTKHQKRVLRETKAKTALEASRYRERDGFVVVCKCLRILNDCPWYLVPEYPDVKRFHCKASGDIIYFDIVRKTRVGAPC